MNNDNNKISYIPGPPVMIYFTLSLIQIFVQGIINTKDIIVMIIISFLLQVLYVNEYSWIAWIIVFFPFVFMILILIIILFKVFIDDKKVDKFPLPYVIDDKNGNNIRILIYDPNRMRGWQYKYPYLIIPTTEKQSYESLSFLNWFGISNEYQS